MDAVESKLIQMEKDERSGSGMGRWKSSRLSDY